MSLIRFSKPTAAQVSSALGKDLAKIEQKKKGRIKKAVDALKQIVRVEQETAVNLVKAAETIRTEAGQAQARADDAAQQIKVWETV